MEIVSLKRVTLLPDLALPGPPISRRGTHEALRAGFWGLKQPTFYIYEMVIPVRRRLHVKESKWTEPTVQVWPHNVFLCKYLEMQAAREGPKYFADKTVLELGAGCGLTGMVAAMLGASVTVVESAALFPQLRHNVDAFSAEWKGEVQASFILQKLTHNVQRRRVMLRPILGKHPQIRCEEESAALGALRSEDTQAKNPLFDIIICSDVSTAEELHYSFMLTLLQLMGEKSEVLLCHTRSCSLDAPPAAADSDHGHFMGRLSEIFDVEEVESEDSIRAFCEQLTGGAQLLRSQSTIDIQECSDVEGRLIILRLRCPQETEGLKAYVYKQLEKEAAAHQERDTITPRIHTSAERTIKTTAAEPTSAGEESIPGKTSADQLPTTADCLQSETERVTRKHPHLNAASLRRSSHKRTFSGARDSGNTDTGAAGWVQSRILRPRITAGAGRESSPAAGTPVVSRTGSSSAASGGAGPSAERCAAAGDAQKTDSNTRLSPSVTQPSAAQSRSVAAGKNVTKQLDAPRRSFTQDKAASPPYTRSAEKSQPALAVSDKVQAAPGPALRLNASSITARAHLISHLSKDAAQRSPSNGLRSRTLSSAPKDTGGISHAVKRGKVESTTSLRPKAPSSPASTEAEQQQVHSRSSTMTAKARSTESGSTPSCASPPHSRTSLSSVAPTLRPLPDASRLVSRRGHSAAPKGTAAQISAFTGPPKNPARPLSTVEPAHTLTSGSNTLRSVQAHRGLQRPMTPKAASMKNKSPSPTMAPRTQHTLQRSGETPAVGGGSKGTFADRTSSLKYRTYLHAAPRDSVPPAKGVTRGFSSTAYRRGGSPL